jgi:methyl-accepting chemotaxis protein
MSKRNRFSLGQRSLMGRLLWPVNIISFVLLFALCTLMVFKIQKSVESAMKSKAEGITTFLQTVGQTYVSNYDLGALENFARVVSADSDFAYVVYLDKDGRPMTESSKESTSDNISKVEKEIHDFQNKTIGKVLVGYKRDRIDEARKETVELGIICLILTQLLLSAAIFLVSRGIVRPLHDSLSRLSKTTEVLSNTSADVSKFSEALSSGVNQQAEVVQETTAAMSEMSSMLSQTSNYAKQSESVMTSVTQKANNGMSVMNQMVESMLSIQQANEQLQQMSEIIQEIGNKTNVINDIVFKTQLLSFNASIEAARAGQHGRGFAVVAEEVGNLAKMSGSAAQEIAALLQDSEKQVSEIVRNTSERISIGKNVTEQALKGFKEIATDINLISSQIGNISSAAREQELGVAQTNQAMSELNKTTDLNGQIAHRASSASGTLSSEVNALTEISSAIESSITGTTTQQRSTVFAAPIVNAKHMAQQSGPGADSHNQVALQDQNFMPSENPAGNVADKIVEMAKKQRADRKSKKSG